MIKLYLWAFCCLALPAAAAAQCPMVAGIMVNACGLENNNEFIFLRSGGTPLNVNDLAIVLPANSNITLANTDDFSPPAVTSVAPLGACITVLDDGGVIPANASVVIFMSNNVSQQYDLTSWCTQYGAVYVLYKNQAAPPTPTYLNNSATPATRTTNLSINGLPACDAAFTYNVPVASVDGDFYQFPTPFAGVSVAQPAVNNGCASPPFQLLPIVLKAFTARVVNGVVKLQWTTSQEQQTHYFEPERSADGIRFAPLGRVPAAGHSDQELSYSYQDATPLTAPVYYRLRTVDLDGSAEYSFLVQVRPPATAFTLTAIRPNPVSRELVVEWNALTRGAATLQISDVKGKLLYSQSVSNAAGYNQAKILVQTFSPGIYYLRLLNGQQALTGKFVKE